MISKYKLTFPVNFFPFPFVLVQLEYVGKSSFLISRLT